MTRRARSALAAILTPHGRVLIRAQHSPKQDGWIFVLDGDPLALELLEPRQRLCASTSHRRTVTPPGGAVASAAIRSTLAQLQARWNLAVQSSKRPAGSVGGPVARTLGELVALHQQHTASGLRASSKAAYAHRWCSLHRVIQPTTPLASIDRERVQQVVADLAASCKSPLTTRNLVGSLLAVLAFGAETGHTEAVSYRGLVLPPLIERHRDVLSDADVSRLLAAAERYDTDAFLLVALAVLAGLRASEVLAAQWADVDLDARTLSVRNRATFTTKNGRSRLVPIGERLHAILAVHRAASGYVVRPAALPRVGRLRWAFRKSYAAVLADAGIDHVPFHGLRRTFATRAVEKGVPLSKVRLWLGHHNIAVTQKYLVHAHGFDQDIDRATS